MLTRPTISYRNITNSDRFICEISVKSIDSGSLSLGGEGWAETPKTQGYGTTSALYKGTRAPEQH